MRDLRGLYSRCQHDPNVLKQVESELERRHPSREASRLLGDVKMSLRRLAESGTGSRGRGSARRSRRRSTKQRTLDQARRLGDAWRSPPKLTTDSLLEVRRPDDAVGASISEHVVRLTFRSGSTDEIHVSQLKGVVAERETATEFGGHHWSRIRIQHADGESCVSIRREIRAATLEKEIEDARRTWWLRELATRADILQSVKNRLTALDDPPKYVDIDSIRDLKEEADRAVDWFEGPWWPQSLPDREIETLKAILSFVESPEGAGKRANEVYVANELERSRELFDRIEAHPLTREQRKAVVVDERHNLVIAAAGSGKTSVIVAKAAWLVEKGLQRPSELLLLAFARPARDEMEERLHKRLGAARADGMTVRTFHSLGSEIIGKAEGKAPSVASTAKDPFELRNLLEGFVEALRDEPKVSAGVHDWFQHLFAPYKSQHDFRSWGEYWDYLRKFSIRALNGEKVESFEEMVVANFLYLNGVNYEYEAPYEYPTATSKKRQYKPDFYLPDYGIYIEHFGLDANGRTASYVDREKYLKSMEWKRRTHRECGTVLIETFSHEFAAGVLLRDLAEKLAGHGVTLSPIPPEQVFAVLREKGRIAPFTRLVATFLRHFKGRGRSFPDLAERAALHRDRARSKAFLKLFRPIFERYQEEVARSGEIDFDDMINRATDLVEAGRFDTPYRYILVDEFQDISPGRARLLQALLHGSPGARLFAVGDDWQAIYRFAGSDTAIMREFEQHFGPFERCDLETTFRCSDRLARVATEFVLRNPAQIRKTVRSKESTNCPALHVGLPGEQGRPLLVEALDRIAEDAQRHDGKPDVLLISRYRHHAPDDVYALRNRYPGLRLDWTTAHSSKGREADYVVVLSLCSGKYGFPSEMVDDPLLDLVLAAPEYHPNADERRLLYVAITRARRQAFLLADCDSPSSFVNELIGGEYDVAVFGRPPEGDICCPRCSEGRLTHRKNTRDGSRFYGCTNYPWCDYTRNAPPS